jgi:hypothetical protein
MITIEITILRARIGVSSVLLTLLTCAQVGTFGRIRDTANH